MVWYDRLGKPRRYRSTRAAWQDAKLPVVASAATSRIGIAHVRAATDGDPSEVNCHPFLDGRLAFAHVGSIAGMEAIRESLLELLPVARREAISGTTDSELLFQLLLEAGLTHQPRQAYARMLEQIADGQHRARTERSIRLTTLHSDGVSLFAFRHATDGSPPSLYHSRGFLPGSCTVASEPLDGAGSGWRPVPMGQCWKVD